MTFDGKAFGLEIVTAVKAHVSDVMAPVLSRLDALEKKIAEAPAPKDGKDADLAEVKVMIDEAIAALPPFPDLPEIPELPDIPAMVSEAVAAIPAPQDGKSVTVEELRPLVEESVSKAVSALPGAKDGQPGKDGVGLAGAIIDRSGNLALTLTDGTTRDLGLIIGKDGDPGKPGVNGADGVGFDDMDMVETDDGVFLRFTRGDVIKEWRLPIVRDCGVYKSDETYRIGDGVTWGGSFWIAQDETAEKPDSGKGWRLAVKKGRDGRDGTVKPDNGPPKVKI